MNSYIFFCYDWSKIINEFFEYIFDFIGGIFNVIWSIICGFIYPLISFSFNIFNKLAELNFLTGKMSGIYTRLTMIITIVMVFYITFTSVKYVVSPDTVSDKEKGAGKIVMRIITAILLIALIPKIFDIGYDLQVRILRTNVIPKVIFGQEEWDYNSAGANFAGDVFAAFYRVNTDNCKTEADCQKAQDKVDSVIEVFKSGANNSGILQRPAGLIYANLNEVTDLKNVIQFDGLLAVIFGGFVLYVLFSYNFDIVTRYLQLIFLQIIAPVAVISYIAPQKDGMLKKWAKQCITTYVDIFIRMAILYFMLLIVSIMSSEFDFYNMIENGKEINIFLYIFIMTGLLGFVHRVPKLLKELFPSSGGAASIGFGFNAKERLEPIKKSIDTVGKAAAPIAVAATMGGKMLATKLATTNKGKALAEAFKNSKLGTKGTNFTNKWATRLSDPNSKYNKYWSKGKALYKGMSEANKTGRFKKGMEAGNRSLQKDEMLAQDGGSAIAHDLLGGYYQNIKAKLDLDIKKVEDEIKTMQGKITLAQKVKKGQDSAEDRAASKIKAKELKMNIKAEDLNSLVSAMKIPASVGIEPQAGQSICNFYSMIEARANSKKAAADAINQELTAAETQQKLILSKADATDKEKIEIQEKVEQLRELAKEKEIEAVDANDAQARAIKYLTRYAVTRTARNDIDEGAGEEFEAGLSSNVEITKESICDARKYSDEKMLARIKDELVKLKGNEQEAERLYEIFITEDKETLKSRLNSREIIDDIQTALSNYATNTNTEVTSMQEEVRFAREQEEYQRAATNASEGK